MDNKLFIQREDHKGFLQQLGYETVQPPRNTIAIITPQMFVCFCSNCKYPFVVRSSAQSGLASRPLANLAGELIFLDFLWSSFELFVVLGAFVPELSCEHLDI